MNAPPISTQLFWVALTMSVLFDVIILFNQ